MKKVLITGISGFIGQALAKRLKAKDIFVAGISRTSSAYPVDLIFQKSLGESIQAVLRQHGFDAIIHAAHFVGPNESDINISGTKLWESEARNAGIPVQIFIGSISAHQKNPTSYGRIKLELEHWFSMHRHIVLNPGLVVGNYGLFGRMKQTVQSQRMVPLLDNGRDKVYLTSLETLLDSIEVLLEGNFAAKVYFIHESKPYSLRQILQSLGALNKRRPFFLSIPSLPIFLMVKLLEAVRIPTPISSSSIKGLKANSEFSQPTDLRIFGCQDKDLIQILKEIQ